MGKRLFNAAAMGISLSVAALCGATAQISAEPVTAAPLDLTALLTTPAAEPAIAPTADFLPPVVEAPVAQPWIWAITPRAWFLWETDHYFQEGKHALTLDGFEFPVDVQISNETTFIPFAGGTVSVTPGLGAPTFSLTALYGEGSGKNRGLVGVRFPEEPVLPEFPFLVDPFGVVGPYEGEVETKRFDVEAIAQIPAAEGVSWTLGARFIRFEREEEGQLFTVGFEPFPVEFDLTQHFYLGEAGFSVNRPINADGSFVAFGNLIGMLGFADVVKRTTDPDADVGVFNMPKSALQGGVVGVDTNAGLGYRLSPNLFASARYRLFYLTAPDFDFRRGGTFMHGPEVNLTFTFGG